MSFSILNYDDLNNFPSLQMGRAGPQGPRQGMVGSKTRSKSPAHGEGINPTHKPSQYSCQALWRDNDMAAKEPLG